MTPFQKKIQELGKANGWSYARIWQEIHDGDVAVQCFQNPRLIHSTFNHKPQLGFELANPRAPVASHFLAHDLANLLGPVRSGKLKRWLLPP
jgi:hypothetical protein